MIDESLSSGGNGKTSRLELGSDRTDRAVSASDVSPSSEAGAANKIIARQTSCQRALRAVALWAPVALWAGFIFFMSAHTGSDLSQGEGFVSAVKRWLDGIQVALLGPGIDLVSSFGHFLEYLVLGVLLARALKGAGLRREAAVFATAAVMASMYGVTDEVHQLFVPDRMCDPADWLVDTVGASIGALSWLGVNRARGWGDRSIRGRMA